MRQASEMHEKKLDIELMLRVVMQCLINIRVMIFINIQGSGNGPKPNMY